MMETLKKHKAVVLLWTLMIVTIAGFAAYMLQRDTTSESTDKTEKVSKTTLTQLVSTSGQIASSGQTSVMTSTSGKVAEVYVSVGTVVKKGDKIMKIDPDDASLQNQKSTWASYLSAKNTLSQANAKRYTLEAAKIAAEQKFNTEAVDKGLDPNDATYRQLKSAMLAAQADYDNQSGVITQAKTAVDSAYIEYQKTSSTVTAPGDGTIQDIAFETGMYITSSSSTTSGGSGTAVATLKVIDKHIATMKVSELDIAGVKPGQDVKLTLTALTGKTYQGKVVSVSSTGNTESNITTFPVNIELTDAGTEVLVGMAVSGDITVQTKENVLAVSNQAITTVGDTHKVTVLKDGKKSTVTVTVGLILDTQTEITSGLSEGDSVVVSTSNTTTDESTSEGPEPGDGPVRKEATNP